MFIQLISALGESDCESIGSGLLAQPVNAVSSLAFSVFGVVVLASVARATRNERTNRSVFGFLMIATGIGSLLFHGPQGPASHFLHDVTFLLTVIAVAVMNVAGLLRWSPRHTWLFLGVSAVVVSASLLLWPLSTNVLAAIALVGIVAVDVAIHRAGSGRSRWWFVAIGFMAVAVVFFVTGRTGGLLCDSTSLLQGHALWHILSGAALWAYFESTTSARVGSEE